MAPQLPSWASVRIDTDGIEKVFVNSNVAYPTILAQLGYEVDQYGVEIAFRCIARLIQGMYPEGVYITFDSAPQWALNQLPEGQGLPRAYLDVDAAYHRLRALEQS